MREDARARFKQTDGLSKSNNLRDEKDKRRIIPDESLRKLFGCKETDNVNYTLMPKGA